MIIGIIGLILIVIAWIPEIVEIIKTKRSNLNIGFPLLYTLGSLLLVVYSIQIKNWIFIILNSSALLLSSIGLLYTIKSKIKNHSIISNAILLRSLFMTIILSVTSNINGSLSVFCLVSRLRM